MECKGGSIRNVRWVTGIGKEESGSGAAHSLRDVRATR